jgi:hypothetical protein
MCEQRKQEGEKMKETAVVASAIATDFRNCSPTLAERALKIPVRVIDILSNYTVLGLLVGFTPGEVAVLVDEPLSEARTVEIRLNSFSFEGQVLYCGRSEPHFETHISIDDIEGAGLRKAPRFPVALSAELLSPDGVPVPIVIRDISRDGMGLESPVAVEVGQPIAIASGPAFVFAIVRHCQPISGGRFRTGVEMHHLFERPEPPVDAAPRGLLGRLNSKWFTKNSLTIDARAVKVAD